jgi:dihydrofolate reductase
MVEGEVRSVEVLFFLDARRHGRDQASPHTYCVACRVTVLGSGSIVTPFAQAGLVDDYQFMVDPVVLGAVASIFKGLKHKLDLKFITPPEVLQYKQEDFLP